MKPSNIVAGALTPLLLPAIFVSVITLRSAAVRGGYWASGDWIYKSVNSDVVLVAILYALGVASILYVFLVLRALGRISIRRVAICVLLSGVLFSTVLVYVVHFWVIAATMAALLLSVEILLFYVVVGAPWVLPKPARK
jgi:hypothetical protein